MLSKNKRQINNIVFTEWNNNSTQTETIAILHGWKQRKEDWEQVATLLAETFRIIVFDLPGFGESNDKSFLSYSPLMYIHSIHEVLEQLHIQNLFLLGHSFGGRLAALYSATYKSEVTKLILYAPAGFHDRSLTSILTSFRLFRKIYNIEVVPIQILRSFVRSKVMSRDAKDAKELLTIFSLALETPIVPYLKEIHQETLLLWGTEDSEIFEEHMKQFKSYLLHSTLIILKGYGHNAHLENPYLFTKSLLSFLTTN